ncbi:MAG TPA: SpoIIE family protein phosphatase [Candidatus Parabacteroides intestinipullorum]|uniref:SpoIIE family protein phosphatase n=1 Tax=Candidatus Parabacteroides intestinipullorum TaxID=2838723 RepID=A0A9D1X5T8_9BACT|nr:SpoIIE family protein phosphatase [Candidatus Parabacteroides intestinipullorum]
MAIKILSVDDEPDLEVLLSHYFRRKIRKGEYEFTFAHNGLEALKLMVEHPDFDIVLSDINMPEMDGLTLLSKINELRNPAQKCIMVSAYGDMKNIRTAMNRGAFDFATKPIDMEDLSLTIEKAVEEVNYIKQTQREHLQLESIQSDLAVAGEIQKAILPCRFPPFPEITDLDIYASMTPAKEIGGDFYDFFRLDEDRIGLVIADVSGKGVPAALFMAVSNTLLRSIALTKDNSRDCIEELNRLICRVNVNSMFVTVFYGILNHRTGALDYTNGGHNPAYVLRGKNGELERLGRFPNLVVGGFEDFSYKSESAQLDPGDSLFLYTDGITEAFDAKDEAFGDERLEDSLVELYHDDAKTIIEGVYADLGEFIGDTTQSDDITMLVVKRLK